MRLIFDVIAAAMVSIVSASGIILALSNWLGKIWANRMLEQDKARYSREIEELKNKFNKELEYYKGQIELSRQALSRYSEHQFSLYNKLWLSLADLKIAGDRLWGKVDEDSVLDFGVAVKRAKQDLLKNALLLEEEHEKELNKILDNFSNYFIGKHRLIQLDGQSKKDPAFLSALSAALARSSITEDNKKSKDQSDALLLLIKESFRKQMRGS